MATVGDLIANNENEPFNSVSRKHFSRSSTVIYLCSIASAQSLGHNSITNDSSNCADLDEIIRQTFEIALITSSYSRTYSDC